MWFGSLVGNGVYVLKDCVVNEKLVVVLNMYYWDNVKMVIQQVIFVLINQEFVVIKCYFVGDIDIIEFFLKNMYQKLLKDILGQVYILLQLGIYYYVFNI